MSGTPPSAAEVREAVRGGQTLKYLFFWGHRPRRDGVVDASCFSQWWPVTFTVDGTDYRSAEHWMMAAKARLFGDDATAERIWGIGLAATDDRSRDPDQWRGLNLLGFALMEVRDRLSAGVRR